MLLASADQMRALDATTIRDFGLPGVALMENAGKAASDVVHNLLLGGVVGRVAIFCGAGNNGGDGYVMARHLVGRGHDVDLVLLAPRARIQGDAAITLGVVEKMAVRMLALDDESVDDETFTAKLAAITGYDVMVDALLGTGLSSEVRGRYRATITHINRCAATVKVCAVDVPSGLHADTGQPLGVAVEARCTVTFGLGKPGLFLEPGRTLAGDVHAVDIGFPAVAITRAGLSMHAIDEAEVVPHLGRRVRASHKGSYGHVFAVAGKPGKTGAAVMTGLASLRAGAGLATVATHAACVPAIAQVAWELMAEEALSGTPLDPLGIELLLGQLQRASVLAVGPGLGDTDATFDVVRAILCGFAGPIVLDADGLNVVRRELALLRNTLGSLVLTPHPGEMARLTGSSVAEILADQVTVARSFACEHRLVVVLKSSTTVVAEPTGRVAINTSGTPGMASAGMGDVLTGIIAGLLAQGMSAWDAARVAVFVHGRAGEHGVRTVGERGLTARTVLDALPQVLGQLEARTDL